MPVTVVSKFKDSPAARTGEILVAPKRASTAPVVREKLKVNEPPTPMATLLRYVEPSACRRDSSPWYNARLPDGTVWIPDVDSRSTSEIRVCISEAEADLPGINGLMTAAPPDTLNGLLEPG